MLIVGISGGSGSGKTSFINDIQKRFTSDQITLLSQDEYYYPREQQYVDTNGVQNFDLPTAIDLDSFVADIQKLKRGETVSRQEYTFNNSKKTPKELSFVPTKILIVEGLFIFHHQPILELLDFTIMINASSVVKVIRRIQRDRVERNYPLDDVLYRYEHHVLPSFEEYIKPYVDKVDIVINNNQNYQKALEMVSVFLESKIDN